MAEFADLARWAGREATLPPVKSSFDLASLSDEGEVALLPVEDEPQPISAFVCIIDYDGNTRLITCRRFDRIGSSTYVGAICHSAHGYRQFRCDRIESVYDPTSGEVLGDGGYFERFTVDSARDRAPTWGLSSSRKATLVAGLNVLAFMARCDGRWHPLEAEVIERFICSMWLRMEWEGDPPLDEIVAHAQLLSPDARTFFHALRHYANSSSSTRILCRAISDLIEADGVICASEASWGAEVDAFFRGYDESEFHRLFDADSSQ